ncbi:hypothetical protein H5410_041197 [Solanum commersonii]|uniref:Uncharacterized protein n=1 Tax=Solanum commersonii TaxID=4109 RepID=A0A9J5XQW5_SOLCO|nr:hypothetical protein H5410_041197 [Solanum commersonii]
MGTFVKLGLKQVVKTTEEMIIIDSDYQNFRLLSENDLAPYRDIYRFMHIDLVQVEFNPLTLRGLPESFIAALRDGRNHNWKKSLIGTVQTSLAYGPVYFNAYPNLQISLQDENSLSSLMLNVKLHGYDYMPGTEVVVTQRPIKWEEIDFPQEWVIEGAAPPKNNINDEILEIEQSDDGTVKIKFSDSIVLPNKFDSHNLSSRLTRSYSSYISLVDYTIQVPSRASTSQLIAANSSNSTSGTSGIDINHPMYKEFMDFMKSKKESDNDPPTYSTILMDEENIEVFDLKDKREVILLFENSDLRWKNEPWQVMYRYLDTVSYTTTVYKYKMHYEIILSATGSCEFQHFYPANTKNVYNFSKMIMKKILAPEEWGMSPLKEMDYIHLEQKVAVKYNYWDYIDGFNKALLYENANKKHSWFIKICSNIFERHIPNWFCRW